MSGPAGKPGFNVAKFLPQIICGAVLLLLVGILIIPTALRVIDKQKKVNRLEEDLAAREALYPFYAQLQGQSTAELAPGLQKKETGSVAKNDISNLAEVFAKLAVENGLEMRSTIPKPYTAEDGRQFLQVKVAAAGAFDQFHPFMLAVTQLPSFIHLLEAQVLKAEQGEEVHLDMWLNIQ